MRAGVVIRGCAPITQKSAVMSRRDGEPQMVQDRYWRVPVMMGGSIFLLVMPFGSFGLFYVFFMDTFGASREDASWPQSAFSMTSHLSGLILFVLQGCMKTYSIVHLSCIITVLALISSSFAPTMIWMTVTFGVIHGLGHGLFITSGAIYILLFFDKYRSIASSLLFGSWGLSNIVSQFVVTRLINNYGLGGTMLLLGAILLHSTAFVMLARSPTATVAVQAFTPAQDRHVTSDYEDTTRNGTVQQCCSPNQLSASLTSDKSDNRQGASLRQAWALFAMPAFYVLLITNVIGDHICAEFLKTVVDYGVDKGFELSMATQLITFSSAGKLLGRIALPVLADMVQSCRYPLYTCSFLAHSAAMMAIPHIFDYSILAALSTVVGASQGYILCMKYALIASYLGVDRTAACSGLVGLVMIPLSALSPWIVGLFRDERGSYDNFYRMLGAMSFTSGVVFFAFYVWNAVRKKVTADNYKFPKERTQEPP